MVTPSHARTTSFSQQQSQQYAPYPSGQTQQQSGYYPQGQDPRNLQSLSSVSYDPSSGAHIPRRSSMSVDRTVPSRMSTHGPVPYARIPPVVSPTYDQEPISEPSIKKKRKRADAEQLRVLNDTYNRTAFPSTEERIELAKKLGMSARSVQIWFQNKRQAMRQNNRQASNALPPTSSEPFTAGPAPNPGANVPPSSSGYIQQPSNPMNSISMSGPGYGSQRVDSYGRPMIPSPTPSVQYRGRSYDDHETLRRPSSRQH
ncbi:hypothetical protein EW026_g2043 [Hermanssonia centrifuga]|uniref:Homeobox domain-containing protein n=1 Tax=Hermanssonia centrifuga TaxID=98765 RepID=A0A4S4KPI2_9APHY|nr:hypothetical protein EW026_g2043 [Hermanssonia centrifuga]